MQFFMLICYLGLGVFVTTMQTRENNIKEACRNAHKELVAYEKCVRETSWSDTTVVLKYSLNKGGK